MTSSPTARRSPLLMVSLLAALASACAEATAPVPDDLLDESQALVAVPRESAPDIVAARSALSSSGAAPSLGVHQSDDTFYLAIRKDVLGQRWFLTAYLKQAGIAGFFVGIPFYTLGTRVVSFKQQNDKVFVFDVSEQREASALNDAPNLLEAYPIVHLPAFDRLRNADQYVLFDPSAGLNRFGVTSNLFRDWGFSPDVDVGGGDPRLRVGLAFMQGFRRIADGFAYEEVFTGDTTWDSQPITAWGTLGLALRPYSVGRDFEPTPEPAPPHYFTTSYRIVPDSGGIVERDAVKWNFHRGMPPVKVYVSAGARRLQADYPTVDVLGAFRRGVESWNDVFGFPVFQTVFVDDDEIRDDDKTFILVDYPGWGTSYAFADFRNNPLNGEIRGGSVFVGGVMFDSLPAITSDPGAAAHGPTSTQKALSLTWGAGPPHRPACVYPARSAAPAGADATTTQATGAVDADQKRMLHIQHVVVHEMGHVLGLRHNFAGSLEPPSSSIMDYLTLRQQVQGGSVPGPYDREAVRYLYGLTPDLPGHAFCTDEDVSVTPLCQRQDHGADPLYDYEIPSYQLFAGMLVDGVHTSSDLDLAVDFYLNRVLGFARDPGFVPPQENVDAIAGALYRTAVPLDEADAAAPAVVARLNRLAEIVLRRIALDEPSLRGDVTADIHAPGALDLVAAQAGQMLRNEDGARTMPLRRTAIDLLERLQTDAAFLELRASRDALRDAIADTATPPEERPFLTDLVTRIDLALNPYFD